VFEDSEEKWTIENRVRWEIALFFSEKVWKTPLGVVSLHEESKMAYRRWSKNLYIP
jgi:hypothetical protein